MPMLPIPVSIMLDCLIYLLYYWVIDDGHVFLVETFRQFLGDVCIHRVMAHSIS